MLTILLFIAVVIAVIMSAWKVAVLLVLAIVALEFLDRMFFS